MKHDQKPVKSWQSAGSCRCSGGRVFIARKRLCQTPVPNCTIHSTGRFPLLVNPGRQHCQVIFTLPSLLISDVLNASLRSFVKSHPGAVLAAGGSVSTSPVVRWGLLGILLLGIAGVPLHWGIWFFFSVDALIWQSIADAVGKVLS